MLNLYRCTKLQKSAESIPISMRVLAIQLSRYVKFFLTNQFTKLLEITISLKLHVSDAECCNLTVKNLIAFTFFNATLLIEKNFETD